MSRYLYKKIQNISPESLNFQHSGLKLTTLGSDPRDPPVVVCFSELWWCAFFSSFPPHLLCCIFLPTLFCRLSVVWIDSCTGRTINQTTFKLLLSARRSRKERKLYRRYRGIRDNHQTYQPPENQVGDLLESCVADNLSNYSSALIL